MVAHLIADVRTGDQFEQWPPHVTLMPWFTAREYDALAGFMRTVEDMEECRASVIAGKLGSRALYGDANDVQVSLLEGPGAVSLGVTHGLLLARFHGGLDDKKYIGGLYSPHIAEIKGDKPFVCPDTLVINSLCLIRRDEKHKTVVAAEMLREKEQ